MSMPILLAACGLISFSVWAALGFLLGILHRFGILDRPNERSSHGTPMPRGGGLAIVPLVLIVWLLYIVAASESIVIFLPILGGALLLWIVSLVDDLHTLSPTSRIPVQIIAVTLGLVALEPSAPIFQELLPKYLDLLAAGILWLWFVNLFNFMDGIDGLSGVEVGSLGVGLSLTGLLSGWPHVAIALPLLLAATAPGFLIWNWQPARIFLGDSGSVPFGYLIGWLLLSCASNGDLAAAIILPAYYLADATITLGLRCLRREPIWKAHREHFYQRAVQGGRSHATVSLYVLVGNLVLICLALLTTQGYVLAGLFGTVLGVGLLLWAFGHRVEYTRAVL